MKCIFLSFLFRPTSGDFRYKSIPVNNDIKVEDVKPEDVKPEDVKADNVKVEDAKLEDVKLENQDMAPQTAKNPKPPQLVGGNAPQIDNSNIGHRMLRKMGWKEGQALGKHQDGIIQPISITMKNGRKGLGLKQGGYYS
jgi:hypothetical protein